MKLFLLPSFLLVLFPTIALAQETDNGPLDFPATSIINNYQLGYIPDSINTLPPLQLSLNLAITHSNFWSITEDNHFLIDGEVTQYLLKCQIGVDEKTSVGVTFRFQSNEGGFLDEFIENFHHTLGLGNSAREYAPRNRLLFSELITSNNKLYLNKIFNWQEGFFLNDIILTSKVQIIKDLLSFRSDLRLPINSPINSFAVSHTAQFGHRIDDFSFYFYLGAQVQDRPSFFIYKLAALTLYNVVCFKFHLEPAFTLITQLNSQSLSANSDENISLKGIVFEIALGFQFQMGNTVVQVAAIENGIGDGYLYTPDISFHFSLTTTFK